MSDNARSFLIPEFQICARCRSQLTPYTALCPKCVELSLNDCLNQAKSLPKSDLAELQQLIQKIIDNQELLHVRLNGLSHVLAAGDFLQKKFRNFCDKLEAQSSRGQIVRSETDPSLGG